MLFLYFKVRGENKVDIKKIVGKLTFDVSALKSFVLGTRALVFSRIIKIKHQF